MGEILVAAPYDGVGIGSVSTTDAAGIEAALANAYALYRNRQKWLSKSRRIEILRKIQDHIHPSFHSVFPHHP